MIQDKTKLQEYQDEWKGVRSFQAKVQRHLNVPLMGIGGFNTHELRNISHNLVLLFAFSVLEGVLKQLQDEGKFRRTRNLLGEIMAASKSAIQWLDYNKVDKAREDRNDIAHRQTIIERDKCWEYIDAIESELVGWQILSAPIPFKH